MSESIGFIGLGIMGQGMARNILEAGFRLSVWNRTVKKMERLVAEGAAPAESPAELAINSDIIVICVSDTADVEAVIKGPGGVLEGARPGSLVIDCSTISPNVTRGLHGLNLLLIDQSGVFRDAAIHPSASVLRSSSVSCVSGAGVPSMES